MLNQLIFCLRKLDLVLSAFANSESFLELTIQNYQVVGKLSDGHFGYCRPVGNGYLATRNKVGN